MLSAWRIVRDRHSATALSGEGAAEFGGRWNLPGTRVAYASGSQALAAIELLVHLNPPVFAKYKAIQLHFDSGLVEFVPLEECPLDWDAEPPSLLSQRFGSRWARESRSAILAVPSAIIPVETNYLINPLHPDFPQIRAEPPRDFALDPRLL